jgi:hypothetical protein
VVELVYRAALVLPAEFLSTAEPLATDFLEKAPAGQDASNQTPSPTPRRRPGRHVYLHSGSRLPPLYVGPYEVLDRADKFFLLAVGGREETVSIDCLNSHLGTGPFSVALPAARGRPPASAPVVFQPQHPLAAATMGGPVAED